jgi:integrase
MAARTLGRPVHCRDLTVQDLVNLYLADRKMAVQRGDLTQESLDGAVRFLDLFEARFGQMYVPALRVGSVETWVASTADGARPWNATTRARCTSMLKMAMRWAKRAGHIDANPLEDLKGPTPLRREKVMTREQVDKLIAATRDQEFKDLLCALLWTGARPKEICTLTSDRADLANGVWRVLDKVRRKDQFGVPDRLPERRGPRNVPPVGRAAPRGHHLPEHAGPILDAIGDRKAAAVVAGGVGDRRRRGGVLDAAPVLHGAATRRSSGGRGRGVDGTSKPQDGLAGLLEARAADRRDAGRRTSGPAR